METHKWIKKKRHGMGWKGDFFVILPETNVMQSHKHKHHSKEKEKSRKNKKEKEQKEKRRDQKKR